VRQSLLLGIAALLAASSVFAAAATPRRVVLDDTDRGAFRAWFTFLADAQFERRSSDVVDCAALIRHAYREALRPHTTAWFQAAQLPRLVSLPDVRHAPPTSNGALLLFRVGRAPERFAEFADAETIVTMNSRRIGRDVRAAEPGDLLYFRHDDAASPSHLMMFVGESRFDRDRRDWLVYHTGPDDGAPGEVRKVALADLERHPSPRWRPVSANPDFVGVFRLDILDREH
jgi:uncharacterized protein YfaT (DUF1175 family)